MRGFGNLRKLFPIGSETMPQLSNNRIGPNDDAIVVLPRNQLRGELRLPGDKSISHRGAMISALAEGVSTLENFSSAEDCAATLRCLQALGVRVERETATVVIEGVGAAGFKAGGRERPRSPVMLDTQNSGTTMRLLAGILAGQTFASSITGDESLRRRPMLRIAEPLRLMGAQVETEANGCAPLRLEGRRPLQAIDYRLPIASAQIKSALLLAGLAADGTTTITEPAATRDHTERMLPAFRAQVTKEANTCRIEGGQQLHACRLLIPGDISSAAFFIAAAVALPGSDLIIHDVGLNPTRTAFLNALRSLGADILFADERLAGGEPIATVQTRGRGLGENARLEISGAVVSNLIDELPLLGFLAASLGCAMALSDAKELRVKESDRIAATVENLKRMGADIAEREDGWQLQPGSRLSGARLDSFGDHRIAMSCAVAALCATGSSEISGARESVAVSLPEFWDLLAAVTE
jgi:3-phosphoshikimate 1-carboxyvinyltransferase